MYKEIVAAIITGISTIFAAIITTCIKVNNKRK